MGGGNQWYWGNHFFFCDMCLPAISLFTMFKEGSSWLIEKWICFKIRDSNPIWWNLLNGTPIPGILKGPNGNLTHPQMEILWLTIQLRDHWNLWHFSDENHWGDKGYYMLPYFCCHFIPLQVQCTWQWNSPTPHWNSGICWTGLIPWCHLETWCQSPLTMFDWNRLNILQFDFLIFVD